jgi:hypothetical protein
MLFERYSRMTFEGRARGADWVTASFLSLALFAIGTWLQAIALFFSFLTALTSLDTAPALDNLRPWHDSWVHHRYVVYHRLRKPRSRGYSDCGDRSLS